MLVAPTSFGAFHIIFTVSKFLAFVVAAVFSARHKSMTSRALGPFGPPYPVKFTMSPARNRFSPFTSEMHKDTSTIGSSQ